MLRKATGVLAGFMLAEIAMYALFANVWPEGRAPGVIPPGPFVGLVVAKVLFAAGGALIAALLARGSEVEAGFAVGALSLIPAMPPLVLGPHRVLALLLMVGGFAAAVAAGNALRVRRARAAGAAQRE